jgi:hypothetical protein
MPSPRRRFRFSLKSLLAAVTIFSVYLAVCAWHPPLSVHSLPCLSFAIGVIFLRRYARADWFAALTLGVLISSCSVACLCVLAWLIARSLPPEPLLQQSRMWSGGPVYPAIIGAFGGFVVSVPVAIVLGVWVTIRCGVDVIRNKSGGIADQE